MVLSGALSIFDYLLVWSPVLVHLGIWAFGLALRKRGRKRWARSEQRRVRTDGKMYFSANQVKAAGGGGWKF